MRQQFENSRHHRLRRQTPGQHVDGELVKELLLRLHALVGDVARHPALKINAAEDERELRGKLHALFNGEPIAELMEHLAKYIERLCLIFKTDLFAKLFQPFLGLLYGIGNRWRYRHCSCFLCYTTSTDGATFRRTGRALH